MIEPGRILQNRYRVEKHIGQGGMGKVYVATDERFNNTVAIKETVFEDLNLRKAFEREARLLNSLRHSALPRVSDHFNEADGQFLVMEYIAGDDLAEMMQRIGASFLLRDVLTWANQLCDALEYLHSQNIIHRDIKPQNLKLTPNGQIVLLDFGLAKGNPTDALNQTAAKSIFGYSRSYASLEQIQGTGTEPRSDLYSLSATLYHLLTGIPPADALTRAMNVLNGQPDPLIAANLINDKIPAGVAAILQKTMALNAGERPAFAAALKEMLEDNDKYADWQSSNSAGISLLTTGFSTQKTELFSPGSVSNPNQSQVQTKILSSDFQDRDSFKTRIDADGDSKVIYVRSVGGKTKGINTKRKTVIAALSGLLVVGTVLCAAYVINPGADRTNANTGIANNETKNSFVISTQPNEESQKSEQANVTKDLPEDYTSPQQSNRQVISKSTEQAKSDSKEAKNQMAKTKTPAKSTKSNDNSDAIVVNEESVEIGDMIVDESGIKMKNAPNAPPIPPEQFKNLNIKQLRRLERLKNLKKRFVIVNPLKPKSTP